MSLNNYVMWGEGVAHVDGVELFDVQNLSVTFGVEVIEAVKGDGGGKIRLPVGSDLNGRCEFLGLNAEMLGVLAGTTSAVGTVKRIRNEEQSKSTNTVTLANTPLANSVRIVADGANKVPLKQVAATPAVGEYSISGAAITLNASQSEDDFIISYMYVVAGSGLTARFGPNSLPSSFELLGSLRAKELFSDVKSDLIIKAAKVERTSELNVGAANRAFANPGFDFNIRVDSLGDLELYFEG